MSDEETKDETPKVPKVPEVPESGDTVEEKSPLPAPAMPPPPDTLGDEKPTSPLVLVVAGVAVLVLLIVIVVSLSGGGHPYDVPGADPELAADEDDENAAVEEAGKSYIKFLYQRFLTGKEVEHDRDEEEMAFRLDEDFYRYPDAEKKRREEKQKLWDWIDDHEKELSEEWTPEDSTTKDVGGLKVWSCTVKSKGIKKDGDNDWKVVDRDQKHSYKFSKINDEWKMVR
jgi:hypothetical protein